MAKHEKKEFDIYTPFVRVEKDTTTPKDEKPTTISRPIVKQPFIGFGKETEAKMTFEDTTKKHPEETKITVIGNEAEVKIPKKAPIKATIYREPIVRVIPRHPFAVGVFGLYADKKFSWGVYTKIQPLEVYKFGIFGFVATNKSYGVGVGYIYKRLGIDVLYQWNDKLIALGISGKI